MSLFEGRQWVHFRFNAHIECFQKQARYSQLLKNNKVKGERQLGLLVCIAFLLYLVIRVRIDCISQLLLSHCRQSDISSFLRERKFDWRGISAGGAERERKVRWGKISPGNPRRGEDLKRCLNLVDRASEQRKDLSWLTLCTAAVGRKRIKGKLLSQPTVETDSKLLKSNPTTTFTRGSSFEHFLVFSVSCKTRKGNYVGRSVLLFGHCNIYWNLYAIKRLYFVYV